MSSGSCGKCQTLKMRHCDCRWCDALASAPFNSRTSKSVIVHAQQASFTRYASRLLVLATVLPWRVLGRAVPVRSWRLFGPFIVGKNELDGKPWHTANVSEIVNGGSIVRWNKVSADASGVVGVHWPEVQWQELVNSVGGHELLEWQALAVGSFKVKADVRGRISCSGVSAVSLDDHPVPFVSDQYRSGFLGHIVDLNAGIHRLSIRLRGKVQAQFQCALIVEEGDGRPALTGKSWLIAPDVVDGVLPSEFFSVLLSNGHPSEWLRNVKLQVSAEGTGGKGSEVRIEIDTPDDVWGGWPDVAPAQHASLTARLRFAGGARGCPKPTWVIASGELGKADGTVETFRSEPLPLSLRCRNRGQSFIFTFVDDDGSVQHAAVVEPLEGGVACASAAALAGRSSGCPVLLTLHGTSISASDSADAYKAKGSRDKDYRFGVAGGWLLAPTRHGAHNWEGPGRLTAYASLRALVGVAGRVSALAATGARHVVDIENVIFAGHSMGGHGAWLLAAGLPGAALCVASSASWLRKDQYADSNKVFLHDIATSEVEPALEALLRSAETEFDVERHAATLASVPVMARVGSKDRTVHPWFTRRMIRTLLAQGADPKNVSITELSGKDHWWWDTEKSNDGGVVNDPQMRDFFAACFAQGFARLPQTWRLVVFNPAAAGSKGGLRILQQEVPHRKSEVVVEAFAAQLVGVGGFRLETSNVRRFEWKVQAPSGSGVVPTGAGGIVQVMIDKQMFTIDLADALTPCWWRDEAGGWWRVCGDGESVFAVGERGPATYGPMRQLFAAPVCGIHGQGDDAAASAALYVANLLPMTGHGQMPLLEDSAVLDASGGLKPPAFCRHLLVVGGPAQNRAAASLLQPQPQVGYIPPLRVLDSHGDNIVGIGIGRCLWTGANVATLALLPWWKLGDVEGERPSGLALLVADSNIKVQGKRGNSEAAGGEDAARRTPFGGGSNAAAEALALLATPTIPPMTRQPLTHLLPDYVVLDVQRTHAYGAGGFLAAGFWNYRWQHDPRASWERSCPPEADSPELTATGRDRGTEL
eukprot:TRINITY_DN29275_c0_g1_i1.p1 TRINITY_DN29275_c0_g1~~TRINITY_DN29275_c0_g1_i1.p1  ORF type:complete len:1064 (+),score=172.94 TRINITY_DN29275_c0_g1_i1:62-3193(+)